MERAGRSLNASAAGGGLPGAQGDAPEQIESLQVREELKERGRRERSRPRKNPGSSVQRAKLLAAPSNRSTTQAFRPLLSLLLLPPKEEGRPRSATPARACRKNALRRVDLRTPSYESLAHPLASFGGD